MPSPNDNILRTLADDLLDLVRKSKKISVEDAAKKLKVPLATVQTLVDFLVEERVFGIEYKFTTPYIYLYKEGSKQGIKQPKENEKSVVRELITREQFYEKAKGKNIPHEHIEGLWKKYIERNISSIKEEFLKKSREKKVPEEKIEGLWNKYLSYL